MKHRLITVFVSLLMHFCAPAQDLVLTVNDEVEDQDISLLYEFLGVQRFAIDVKVGDGKKHDVVWVAHSISSDGLDRRDTLFNTLPYQKIFDGGWPQDPLKDVVVLLGEVDSTLLKIKGNGWEREIEIAAGSYRLSDGINSFGKPVERKYGEPIPVMIYSQPYVDKNNSKVSRFCFTNDIPAEAWCSTFGVPHLVILELTVLP